MSIEETLEKTVESLRQGSTTLDEIRSLLQSIQKACQQAKARIAELEAQLADYRESGASAVRHAPTSAYWSRELRRLFGDDARAGIDKTEAQVRAAGAEALEKMAVEFDMKGKDEDVHHAALAYFAAAKECRKEARRLRGEGNDVSLPTRTRRAPSRYAPRRIQPLRRNHWRALRTQEPEHIHKPAARPSDLQRMPEAGPRPRGRVMLDRLLCGIGLHKWSKGVTRGRPGMAIDGDGGVVDIQHYYNGCVHCGRQRLIRRVETPTQPQEPKR